MADIQFDHVIKTYRLGSKGSLREAIMGRLARRMKKTLNQGGVINALDDVSFQANRSEVLGIIGNNGAGKTTILKLISRVTYPTAGKVMVKGRVSSLIELGAGFHPDLSGAENIYLNASILGLKRKEIDARFDEIVAFSGLERFLDTPLKRYSSGMYARLAFSVAAHVDPDVLLVDEVLSVGDALFQDKSISKMNEFKKQGKTMLFVSHNMVAVQSLCSRVIWLEHGRIKAAGSPEEVISQYLHYQHYEEKDLIDLEEGEDVYHYQDEGIAIHDVRLLDKDGRTFETVTGGEPVQLEAFYEITRPLARPVLEVYLTDRQHYRLTGSRLALYPENGRASALQGKGIFSCQFSATPVRPAPYYFNIDVHEEGRLLFRKRGIGPLIVRPDLSASKWEDYNLFNVSSQWTVDGNIITASDDVPNKLMR